MINKFKLFIVWWGLLSKEEKREKVHSCPRRCILKGAIDGTQPLGALFNPLLVSGFMIKRLFGKPRRVFETGRGVILNGILRKDSNNIGQTSSPTLSFL